MCYARPGPRCTSHARTALAKTKQQYEAASTAYAKVFNDDTADANHKAQATFHAARTACIEAQDDYDATPGGIRELDTNAKYLAERKASWNNDTDGFCPISTADVVVAQTRATNGARRRQQQLVAHQASQAALRASGA